MNLLMNSSDFISFNSFKDLFLFTFKYVASAYMKNPIPNPQLPQYKDIIIILKCKDFKVSLKYMNIPKNDIVNHNTIIPIKA